MAIHGKFEINNDADFSLLTLYGVGGFQAFSGDGAYRNQGGCTTIPDKGSIPAGKYWIVDRPEGGLGTQVRTWFYDKWNYYARDVPVEKGEWFALYRDDGSIDDYTWVNGIKRGNFRLHPGTVSKGCITLRTFTDFQVIRNKLLRTSMVPVRSTGLMAYGSIEVFAHGDKCLV